MANKSIRERFGSQVRKLRKQKGVSQEALAHLAGIERSYMGAIERGVRNPSLEKIHKIALALKVSLSDLFKF